MESQEKRGARGFFCHFLGRLSENRAALLAFATLALAVAAILTVSALGRRWNTVLTAALTLLLLLLPPLAEVCFSLRLPPTLKILSYLFIFSAGILGEIGGFYQRFPIFDDLLHTFCGYMFAAFGFCLFALLVGRGSERAPSPLLVTLLAFCFSVTVGVLWELFEFSADRVLHTDMQKDALIPRVDSVRLAQNGERVGHFWGIERTVIVSHTGETVTLTGYLDVGLSDTMADLAMNLVGAALFCAIGYLYLAHRRGRVARHFIPEVLPRKKKSEAPLEKCTENCYNEE